MTAIGRPAVSAAVVEALKTKALEVPDIRVFRGARHGDFRGWVGPTYNRDYFPLGLKFDLAHENHCFSPRRGTIRRFHYQLPPHGQAKLIRVTRGRMLDVNVDLRRGSPTFGRHVKVELTPDGWSQILVPVGFAHCYCTLEDDTEVIFKLGAAYAPGPRGWPGLERSRSENRVAGGRARGHRAGAGSPATTLLPIEPVLPLSG
jgi:dTDP-4-dehydrorhamnose 3,5-epimerase